MRRPFQHGVLGPLFAYDLVASTRRGQHLSLRLLVAFVLLLGLYLLYVLEGVDPFDDLFGSTKQLDRNVMPGLAQRFAATCLIVQYLLVLLLTPILVGETIAREKERRTLDFLFVTELTNREIIVGKLAARLTYLFGVLLTSLPVLALTWLFGGIDPRGLLASYVVLLSTLVSLGSIAILLSVWARTALEATLCAYLISGLYGAVFPCVLWPIGDPDAWLLAGLIAAVNALIAAGFIFFAARDLRVRAELPHRPQAPDTVTLPPLVRAAGGKPRPDEPRVVVTVRRRAGAQRVHRAVLQHASRSAKPDVGDRPLLWKELYFHAVTRELDSPPPDLLIVLGIMVAGLVGILWLTLLYDPRPSANVAAALNSVVRFLTIALGGILGLGVIAHTSGSITRERERDTLGALLTIPHSHAAILEAKWLAGFLSLRGVMIALGAVWLVGLLVGAVHPVALFWLVLAVAAPLECLASLGLCLSVMNTVTLRAHLAAALCLLLIVSGPWLAMNYIEWLTPYRVYNSLLMEKVAQALMPPIAWTQAALTWDEYAKVPKETRTAILLGALSYAVAAWLLWRLAAWQFRRKLI